MPLGHQQFVDLAKPFNERLARSSIPSFCAAARLVIALLPEVQVSVIMPKYGMIWTSRGAEAEATAAHGLAELVIERGALVWVEDATGEARFAEDPRVTGAPFLRAHIGAPIRYVDGVIHGVLCITSPDILRVDPDRSARIQDIADLLADIWSNARSHRLARADLLASMSHEVRTLLNGVLGMAHAIGQSTLTEAQQQRLSILKQSGENLLEVLSDFPNAGASQAAFLPQATSTSDPPLTPAPIKFEMLRVLAAEDNLINQLVLKSLLGPVGIKPHIVRNGAQAVEAWRDQEWDVILMDVQMPVMDGPSATRAIRELELEQGRSRTPIIALTANTLVHQTTEYTAIGMDDVVPKPIQMERLLGSIRTLLTACSSTLKVELNNSPPNGPARAEQTAKSA